MFDFIAENALLRVLVILMVFPGIPLVLGYVFESEVNRQWVYAPKWYKKVRDSRIGQIAIGMILLLFLLLALGAFPNTPAFYEP